MPKPRLVPPAMVPPAMPSGVLSHIANDQWVMMTTQWVMMTTRNTILTAKSLSWTKPGTCESGRLRGQIHTSTGKRAKSVHLGWCRSLSGTRRRHGPNLVDRAARIGRDTLTTCGCGKTSRGDWGSKLQWRWGSRKQSEPALMKLQWSWGPRKQSEDEDLRKGLVWLCEVPNVSSRALKISTWEKDPVLLGLWFSSWSGEAFLMSKTVQKKKCTHVQNKSKCCLFVLYLVLCSCWS